MLPIGAPAPDFSLPCQTGETVRLSQFAGRRVILYFYPKDNTAGCTAQARAYSELLDEFEARNAVVIGVNPGSAASHAKFAEKQSLRQLLLADEGAQVAQAYGVWQEKKLYGKVHMGIVRSTYLLDEAGRVADARFKVKAADDARETLALLDE